MPSPRIPKKLAEFVRQRANSHCEYCQTSEWLSGQRCQVDHIKPRVLGGETDNDNLCLACAACNGYKLDRIEAIDPLYDGVTPLFNPRQQIWSKHFVWDEEGTRVVGLTATGRATISALRLNRPLAISARSLWVSVDCHPPLIEIGP